MTRLQIGVVSFCIALFLLIFFGFDTKPSDRSSIERQRSLNAVSTNINVLLPAAKSDLSPDQLAIVSSLEQAIQEESVDTVKTKMFENLSSFWYNLGRADISGHYAAQIANMVNTPESWSIAGTTFAIGAQRLKDEKVRSFCTDKAVEAFESAISLDPANINNRINLAVCYTDNPPADNPMKGIQMLLELSKSNPEAVGVQTTLARLAIKTGQYDKAVERLEKVIAKEDDNRNAICLLAKAYEGLGVTDKANIYQNRCNALLTN